MRQKIIITILILTALILSGCPEVNDYPCDGNWEFSQIDAYGRKGSVSIYVIRGDIYSFHGEYFNPDTSEVFIDLALYGDVASGVPITPLYYNDENGGYFFEYPEGMLPAGIDAFSGTLWPETGAAYCAFSSTSPIACYIETESEAFTSNSQQ